MMTDLMVAVPTRGRSSNGGAITLTSWPRGMPLHLVVRPEEARQYRQRVLDVGRSSDEVVVLPEDRGLTIGDVRQWIMEEVDRRGRTRVLMLDDDLRFTVRGRRNDDRDGVKLAPCEVADFEDMVRWVDQALTPYHHVAISMRDGNHLVPGLGATRECGRGIRAVGYRTDHFRNGTVRFRPDLLAERTDMDVTLQLLRLGQPNLITYHWAQDHRSAGSPGGMHGQRTLDTLDASARQLMLLHPGVVTTREKTNMTGHLRGTRTEVTVQWARALREGRGA